MGSVSRLLCSRLRRKAIAECFKAYLESAWMSRPLDRRQALITLLRGTTALGGAAWLAGCAANGGTGAVSTGAIGSSEVERSALAPPEPAGAAKVALLLPLSGSAQTSLIAKAMQQAAELALFERHAAGLQLVVKDDKGTEAGARAAAEEAIKAGAEIILGPLFSKTVTAMAPVARGAGIPVVAFSNDPAAAAQGVHLIGFAAETEVARVVAYAASQGRRRFAALIPDDADGRLIETGFRAAVARNGGTIGALEHYEVGSNSLIEPARRIRDAIKEAERDGTAIDTLFLPAGQDTLPQLASLLPHSGIDTAKIKLIGTSGWDTPNVNRQSRLAGAWFAAPRGRAAHGLKAEGACRARQRASWRAG